jgi:hypothetical protein
MKRLNIFLIAVNIICLLFIIQIQFQIFYLNPLNYSNSIVEKVNTLILIFSTGWILSTIFHLVVNILPNMYRQKVTETIIKDKLISIAQEMKFLISYIYKRSNFKENVDDISELKIIKGFPKNHKVIIQRDYGKDEEIGIKLVFNGETTEFEFIHNQIKTITNNCDYILNLPFIDTVDFNLIKLLTEIKSSNYLEILCIAMEQSSTDEDKEHVVMFISPTDKQSLLDFKLLYDNFKKQINLISEVKINEIKILK